MNNKDFTLSCKGIAIIRKVVYSNNMYDQDQEPFLEEKPKRNTHIPILIGIASFIIFCIIIGLVFGPRVTRAIHDSNILELIEQAETKSSSIPSDASICFVISNGSSTSFREEKVRLFDAPTTAHAVLEALLQGPSKDSSFSTLIPKGTRLIGVTISQGYAFVDLSKEFTTKSETTFLAIQQISRTLKSSYPSLKKTVILVEGETIN